MKFKLRAPAAAAAAAALSSGENSNVDPSAQRVAESQSREAAIAEAAAVEPPRMRIKLKWNAQAVPPPSTTATTTAVDSSQSEEHEHGQSEDSDLSDLSDLSEDAEDAEESGDGRMEDATASEAPTSAGTTTTTTTTTAMRRNQEEQGDEGEEDDEEYEESREETAPGNRHSEAQAPPLTFHPNSETSVSKKSRKRRPLFGRVTGTSSKRQRTAGTSGQPVNIKRKRLAPFLEQTISAFIKRDDYGFFLEPVDTKLVPDYLDVIQEPMDFGTMRAKVERKEYRTLDDFKRDFLLVCQNARKYNKPETIYHRSAAKIQEYGERFLERNRSWIDPDDLPEMVESVSMPERNHRTQKAEPLRADPKNHLKRKKSSHGTLLAASTSPSMVNGPAAANGSDAPTFLLPSVLAGSRLAEEHAETEGKRRYRKKNVSRYKFRPDGSLLVEDPQHRFALLPHVPFPFYHAQVDHQLKYAEEEEWEEGAVRNLDFPLRNGYLDLGPYEHGRAHVWNAGESARLQTMYGDVYGHAYVDSVRSFTAGMSDCVQSYVRKQLHDITHGHETWVGRVRELVCKEDCEGSADGIEAGAGLLSAEESASIEEQVLELWTAHQKFGSAESREEQLAAIRSERIPIELVKTIKDAIAPPAGNGNPGGDAEERKLLERLPSLPARIQTGADLQSVLDGSRQILATFVDTSAVTSKPETNVERLQRLRAHFLALLRHVPPLEWKTASVTSPSNVAMSPLGMSAIASPPPPPTTTTTTTTQPAATLMKNK